MLVVDDAVENRLLVTRFLENKNFRVLQADSGEKALEKLERHRENIHTIVLDWMMPGMDGIQVLKTIKKKPSLRRIPVILQTARDNREDITTGIDAGAYYYLTKPLEKKVLVSIVRSAVSEFNIYRSIRREMEDRETTSNMLTEGKFRFRGLRESEHLARWLSRAFPAPADAVVGIIELFYNSIEHGNLGIGYEETSELRELDDFRAEIERRLALPEHRDKYVDVNFQRTDSEIRMRIKDQGMGFDFEKYLQIDKARIYDNHGRGIFMSGLVSFDEIKYIPPGNQVEVVKRLD